MISLIHGVGTLGESKSTVGGKQAQAAIPYRPSLLILPVFM